MTQPLKLTPPSQVILQLTFDADQDGSDLSHFVVRGSPTTPDPNPTQGRHADSLYFAPGEQVLVQVIGSGSKGSSFDSFQVIDCAIITRPQVVQRGIGLATKYAAPSPFLQAVGASYPLELDFYASVNPLESGGERVVVQNWKHALDVALTPGMWDLSLVLTVRITRGPGSVDEVRVLSFDPETEVGSTGTVK